MGGLPYLLACWFHQDWDIEGRTAAEVVRTFCREERPEDVLAALRDTQRLLDRDLSEDELAAELVGPGPADARGVAPAAPRTRGAPRRVWRDG